MAVGLVRPPILIQAECQFCGMIKAEEIAGSFQKAFQVHLGWQVVPALSCQRTPVQNPRGQITERPSLTGP